MQWVLRSRDWRGSLKLNVIKHKNITSRLNSIFILFPSESKCIQISQEVYIIDQTPGQDGWILTSFSFCVFMDRDEGPKTRSKNAKRERGQYPAILTELAWSIKDLLYGIKSSETNDLRTCLFSSTEKETS